MQAISCPRILSLLLNENVEHMEIYIPRPFLKDIMKYYAKPETAQHNMQILGCQNL